jgi:hypothetical protein
MEGAVREVHASYSGKPAVAAILAAEHGTEGLASPRPTTSITLMGTSGGLGPLTVLERPLPGRCRLTLMLSPLSDDRQRGTDEPSAWRPGPSTGDPGHHRRPSPRGVLPSATLDPHCRPGDQHPGADVPDSRGQDRQILRQLEDSTALAFQQVEQLPPAT